MITIGKNHKELTLSEITKIRLQRPFNAKSYWKGITHGELINVLQKNLIEAGFEYFDCYGATNQDGSDAVGVMELQHKHIAFKTPGLKMQIGFVNSNSLRRSLQVVFGAEVSICSNGLVSGQLLAKHRHTEHFDLNAQIKLGVSQIRSRAGYLDAKVKNLRMKELTIPQEHHLIVEAARSKLIPWSRMADVVQEIENSTYKYDCSKHCAWAVLNAFTVVIKRSPPLDQLKQIAGVQDLITRLFY